MFLIWHPWFTTTNLSYRSPILETSATASRGTTGNKNQSKTLKINYKYHVVDIDVPVIKRIYTTCKTWKPELKSKKAPPQSQLKQHLETTPTALQGAPRLRVPLPTNSRLSVSHLTGWSWRHEWLLQPSKFCSFFEMIQNRKYIVLLDLASALEFRILAMISTPVLRRSDVIVHTYIFSESQPQAASRNYFWELLQAAPRLRTTLPMSWRW